MISISYWMLGAVLCFGIFIIAYLVYVEDSIIKYNTLLSQKKSSEVKLQSELEAFNLSELKEARVQIEYLTVNFNKYVEDSIIKYNTLLSQKKSSEVKLGQISEQIAPFTDGWPYDPKNFRFLGSPIDGISFESDHIVFMEIKSGSSKKTKKQKDIRDMVNNSKIKFVTFRVDEEGSRIEEEYSVKAPD